MHTITELQNTNRSGWTEALKEAEIASSVVLKMTHFTRTRHTHQITALTLKTSVKAFYISMGKNLHFYSINDICSSLGNINPMTYHYFMP